MRKRFAGLLLAAMLLTGCQLAIPEETRAVALQTEDRIVGMLITLDPAQPNGNADTDALHLASNQGKRIYAQLQQERYEGQDGTERTTSRMVFPEGSGIAFMGYEMGPETSQEEPYWTSTLDDGIYLEKNNFSSVNGSSFVQLEAVIYVSQEAEDLVLYMNPVFQKETGEVYALGVSPVGYHGASMADYAVSYGKTDTETENGEETKAKGYVKMTLRRVQVPDFYRIVQMDSNDQVIITEDIYPADLPEEYAVEESCAYIILEEHTQGQAVKRSVKSRDDPDALLDVLYPMENGICHYGHTRLGWEDAE